MEPFMHYSFYVLNLWPLGTQSKLWPLQFTYNIYKLYSSLKKYFDYILMVFVKCEPKSSQLKEPKT